MNIEVKSPEYREILCRGRRPFASAEIVGGEEFPQINGRVDFYLTPLGVLICADINGLPIREESSQRAVAYNFCINGDSAQKCNHCRNTKASCRVMPTVYEKNGSAWCSVLTKKISPSDIMGKTIAVHERSAECLSENFVPNGIAYGNITVC